jgi:hypothetical protein
MAFFKRELNPVERFDAAFKEKQAARRKLVDRLGRTEAALAEQRAAAERLAVAGAPHAKLDRAEAGMRDVEERAKALRAELAECEEQIVATERALGEARLQRDRDREADGIEAMAAAIERATPSFNFGAASLVEAVATSTVTLPEATRFSANVEAVRREVLSAVELICWDLRSAAVRTRAGNMNVTAAEATAPDQQRSSPEIERQMIYTLNPLTWREGDEVRRAPAFARAGLPRHLLAFALRHQHVDHLNARRVQTLMHVQGSAGVAGELAADDPLLVDLDALVAAGTDGAKADVA